MAELEGGCRRLPPGGLVLPFNRMRDSAVPRCSGRQLSTAPPALDFMRVVSCRVRLSLQFMGKNGKNSTRIIV